MSKATVKDKLPTDMQLLSQMVSAFPLEWMLVWCNPNCERRAHSGLVEKGILTYFPQQSVQRVHARSKRKYTVQMPVFCRYLFVALNPYLRQGVADIRSCDGVEGFVSFSESKAPMTLTGDQIAAVVETLNDGETIRKGSAIEVGTTLRLFVGVFSGFELTVTAYDEARERVTGDVPVFGRPTQTTVSVDDLEAVD